MLEHLSTKAIKILKVLLLVAFILLSVFLAFRLGLFLLPFVIAYAISSLMEPMIKLFTSKLKIPRRFSAVISLLIVLGALGSIVTALVTKIITESISLYYTLPDYTAKFYKNVNNISAKANDFYLWLPEEITKNIGTITSKISDYVVKVLDPLVKGAITTAVSIPEAVVFTLVTILSTYFIASDREKIYEFFKSQLPEAWILKIRSIKNDMFSALFGYIRAQLILMSITFIELSTGFSIVGVKHPFIFAVLIALIDALPILGTGSILIPWSVYNFVTNDIRLGISLLIIYAIVLVVRQMIEPKIVSQQIGLHPLVTLIAMYSGLQLFGFGGLILGPITVLLLKNIFSGLFHNGIIKEFINRADLHQENKQNDI